MIYYAGWLYLVGISLIVSILAFIWGARTGQFSDQDRARFFALGPDLLSQPVKIASRRKQRLHNGALLGIIMLCLSILATALVLGILRRAG